MKSISFLLHSKLTQNWQFHDKTFSILIRFNGTQSCSIQQKMAKFYLIFDYFHYFSAAADSICTINQQLVKLFIRLSLSLMKYSIDTRKVNI